MQKQKRAARPSEASRAQAAKPTARRKPPQRDPLDALRTETAPLASVVVALPDCDGPLARHDVLRHLVNMASRLIQANQLREAGALLPAIHRFEAMLD